ncbi:MAG: SDR family oxidoreductase [Rhodobacteraceae bacterium]|nr:MAG: SDR family oxidoreductase [Paracoccaceae bacterium]
MTTAFPPPQDEFDEAAIAVIGMACRLPGAPDIDAFWDVLAEGRDAITRFTRDELRAAGIPEARIDCPGYVPAKGLLPEADSFDADVFGLSPTEAALMDPQQRVFVDCAFAALEHAGHGGTPPQGPVGVFGGSILSMYLLENLWPNRALVKDAGTFQAAVGNDPTFLATRTSYLLNLTGPSVSLGTACSTSLVAVHVACQSLIAHESDMALAGGVSIHLPLVSGYQHAPDSILSPDGACRPFDVAAAGTVSSDGAGVVVLKRLADARAAGDTVHAVICGSAINNDGADKVGFTAPSVSPQARVIAEAQDLAGTPPETIAMIEAHAAGTAIGDPVEVAALAEVFAGGAPGACALGSVKSNIGHVDAAAGIAGLLKAVLALRHRAVPPSVHFTAPNPRLGLERTPFRVPRTLEPHDPARGVMRAGVSSFGIGGTNCHVVLQEAPPSQPCGRADPADLLLVSAPSPETLTRTATALADHLRAGPPDLGDLSHTLRLGRRALACRAAIVAGSVEEAATQLASVKAPEAGTPRDAAFLFPGLGDHYPAMGWELYCLEEAFRGAVDHCADLLQTHLDGDIRDVLYPGKDWRNAAPGMIGAAQGAGKLDLKAMLKGAGTPAPSPMDRPSGGQPAIFVTEYALTQMLAEWGIRPRAMVGYSIGEFVAACVAGVISLADALQIVAARARLIETRIGRGAMLAVPLSASDLDLPERLSLGAISGERLSIVSGPEAQIDGYRAGLETRGTSAQRLPGSFAFHSAMMDGIVPDLAERLAQIPLSPPRIACVSCVTGDWLSAAEATDPGYWAHHLSRTVRFRDAVEHLVADPALALLELGPGQSLTAHAIAMRSAAGAEVPVIPLMKWAYSSETEWRALLAGIGRYWAAGGALDPERLLARDGRRRVPLPGTVLARERHWIDPPERVAAMQGRRPVEDWVLLPCWKPAPLAPARPAPGSRWLILDDGGPEAGALIAALQAAGCEVIRGIARRAYARHPDRIEIDPADPTHYTRLFEDLAAAGKTPDGIVHFWALEPPDAGTPRQRFDVAQQAGFHCLTRLIRAAMGQAGLEQLRLLAVTRGLAAMGQPPVPDLAPLLGLLKVAPQERPGLDCAVIDLAPGMGVHEAAEALLADLAAPLSAPLVALRTGQRWVEDYAPVRLPAPATSPIRDGGTYLITGGLGSVGMAMARHLAQSPGVRLALLGRTPLAESADDPRTASVADLRAAGARVLTLAADVADPEALAAAFDTAEAGLGPIHGVFHCAGAIGAETFCEIARTTEADAARQFHAKVHGTRALDRVLATRETEFCVLFSSLASILGGLGFASYAAANLFLDAFARSKAGQAGPRWLSINWDAWRTGEVKAAVAGFGGTVSEFYMLPEEAAAVCDRLLALPGVPQAVVSTGDLQARLTQWVTRATKPPTIARHKRKALKSAYAAPRGDTEAVLAEIWQDLFSLERIGIHDDFFELGGHSLLATQLNARIFSRLGAELSLAAVLAARTIADLAVKIDASRAAGAEDALIDGMLDDLADLDPEALERLLSEPET